jgi:uncharacterized membrane protein
MKSNHKGIAEGVLFALNIFILFLILFGNRISIPLWLQPVGRMHPLILHFPIVILILAMGLEFFRSREEFKTEKIYQTFTSYLLLTGAILAAVTAIMGLFLAKEAGYTGSLIQWHKWWGVSIVFIVSIIYWCRNAAWYSPMITKIGTILTVLCLVVAGHFGADITHGDNFVLGPVMQKKRKMVPIEKALVFRDVIQPIFENKCIACHNEDKLKGGLILTNERSILKGGRTGKLFVPGQPQVSLILQRIHLPADEKKHMPPVNKTQLTTDEMTLLYLWIKNNPDFKKKIIELPATDSLRVIASTFLKPVEKPEEKYDFAATNDKEIKKLNNYYRAVYALAKESPALAVNIYNKATYQPKVLEELSSVKKQIVSLDLNKMPVKDADLKIISRFENLRTLNLNFTDITGISLKELASLKHLSSLSLAGTKLSPQAITQISTLKSLTKLAIWNTGLKNEDLQQVTKNNKNLELIKGFKDDGKPIKLNLPQTKNTQFVFGKPVPLLLSHPVKGVDIRYTTDGTDPDSIKSAIYIPGIIISENTVIKAKAFKAGWLGSDVIQFNFYKSIYTPDSISFIAAPDEKYKADGAKSLIDKELGGPDFGNGKWVASQKDMEVYIQFSKPINLRSITLNAMQNPESQIFLPEEIQILAGKDNQHLKLFGTLRTKPPMKKDPFNIVGLICKPAAAHLVSCVKIMVKPQKKLPAWHPAKGKPGWVFIDELFFN